MKTIQINKLAELAGHAGAIYTMSLIKNNSTLLSGSADKMIGSWNILTFTPNAFSVKTHAAVYSICYIETCNYLCVGLSNGSIHIIDLSQKKEIKNIVYHRAPLFHLLYNPHNQHLYTVCGNGILSIWDVNSFKLLITLPLGEYKLRQLALYQNHLAVACGNGNIKIFETQFYNEVFTLQAHTDSVYSLKYSPTHKILISGGKDAHLKFWDITNHYKIIKSIPAHNYAIYSIDLNTDESLMITGSRDKTVKLWDIPNFEIVKRIDRKNFQAHTHSVNAVLWLTNKRFVSAGDDKKIIFWETEFI